MEQNKPQDERPLRILHLASHDSLTRGGAVQMLRLARGLALRGHQVTAAFNAEVAGFENNELVARAGAAGVRFEGIVLRGQGAAESLRKLWRSGDFDVLHVHREAALLAAAAALKNENVHCFVAQRGTVYLPKLLGPEHRLLLSRRVNKIIAVAQAVKQALILKRLIPPSKIEAVYGGVETEVFQPGVDGSHLRLKYGVPQGSFLITLPGALIEKKGPADFLQSAALLHAQRQGLRFWLVGKGKLEEQLSAQANQLGLGETIQFLGHVENMPEVYAASDLVVCASIKGEGLTGTLREALAMARPVVTTNCAGNTELVEEGKTGYVAAMRNPQSLAAAMLRALNDTHLATQLASAGRARVLAWCAEDVRSEKVEAIYREIIKKKGQ